MQWPRLMPLVIPQVTVSLSEDVDISTISPYLVRCQFGEKVIPAQSVFAAPESQGLSPVLKILCTVRSQTVLLYIPLQT